MKLATAALAAVLTIVAMPAQAALHLVGQWQVDQGPFWATEPAAYTGQEAAALLFGGTAASYQISTVGPSVASIDHKAWYSVLGVGGRVRLRGELQPEVSRDHLWPVLGI